MTVLHKKSTPEEMLLNNISSFIDFENIVSYFALVAN